MDKYGSKMRHSAKKLRTSQEVLNFFIQSDRLGISSPKVYKAFATMVYNASHSVDFF